MKTYLVEWADWQVLYTDTEEIVFSDKIDDRTFRSKHFTDEDAALVFAKLKLEDSDDFLAFIEVKEVTLLKKVK